MLESLPSAKTSQIEALVLAVIISTSHPLMALITVSQRVKHTLSSLNYTLIKLEAKPASKATFEVITGSQ